MSIISNPNSKVNSRVNKPLGVRSPSLDGYNMLTGRYTRYIA